MCTLQLNHFIYFPSLELMFLKCRVGYNPFPHFFYSLRPFQSGFHLPQSIKPTLVKINAQQFLLLNSMSDSQSSFNWPMNFLLTCFNFPLNSLITSCQPTLLLLLFPQLLNVKMSQRSILASPLPTFIHLVSLSKLTIWNSIYILTATIGPKHPLPWNTKL